MPQVDYAARSVGERDVTWTLNTLRKVARELGVSAARAAAAYDSRSGEVRAEPYNVRDRPALTMALTLRTLRGELLAGERVNGEFSRPKRWSRPQEPPRPLPPEWPDDDWPGASPQMPGQDALMMSVTRTAPAPAGLEAR